MKSVRQRQDEQREEKLAKIRRQVAEGSLVIRQMTADERREHPAQPRKSKRS